MTSTRARLLSDGEELILVEWLGTPYVTYDIDSTEPSFERRNEALTGGRRADPSGRVAPSLLGR